MEGALRFKVGLRSVFMGKDFIKFTFIPGNVNMILVNSGINRCTRLLIDAVSSWSEIGRTVSELSVKTASKLFIGSRDMVANYVERISSQMS